MKTAVILMLTLLFTIRVHSFDSKPLSIITQDLSASTNSDDNPQVIALESGPAPAELGGSCASIDGAAINGTGEIAFGATLSDSAVKSTIFLQSGVATGVLLKAGDAAPVGGGYKKFLELR